MVLLEVQYQAHLHYGLHCDSSQSLDTKGSILLVPLDLLTHVKLMAHISLVV